MPASLRTFPASFCLGLGLLLAAVSGCDNSKFAAHKPATGAAELAEPGEGAEKRPEHNTESYDRIVDNPFLAAAQNPLSTFSIDVDTASYSNVRRFLREGKLPPRDAVRIEELVNYFPYDYPTVGSEHPIGMTVDVAGAPWNAAHRLVRIALAARRFSADSIPARNYVFLIDVSGSMNAPNRLPLVKQALALLVEQLTGRDRVGIVVYAGTAGLVLPSTSGQDKSTILNAIGRLEAGGSTNGGEGIQLAYEVAQANFMRDGINRVILATDGDFNVGVTNQGDLTRLIEQKRKSGIYLTVLGFGMGDYKDSTLQNLAHYGNGHHAYIDSLAEARKVFVDQGAALVTVANDVKVQVEFNPERVQAYRLIGYENRLLRAEDFNDDRKDAGDMGAGHTVTALYEVVPPGVKLELPGVDSLKYQKPAPTAGTAAGPELLTVKVRYKEPTGETSKLLSTPVADSGRTLAEATPDFRFAAAVAGFGMLLRDSPYKGSANFEMVRTLAQNTRGADPQGYRAEFVQLVDLAASLGKVEQARTQTSRR